MGVLAATMVSVRAVVWLRPPPSAVDPVPPVATTVLLLIVLPFSAWGCVAPPPVVFAAPVPVAVAAAALPVIVLAWIIHEAGGEEARRAQRSWPGWLEAR
jgi:hypothetical protein